MLRAFIASEIVIRKSAENQHLEKDKQILQKCQIEQIYVADFSQNGNAEAARGALKFCSVPVKSFSKLTLKHSGDLGQRSQFSILYSGFKAPPIQAK